MDPSGPAGRIIRKVGGEIGIMFDPPRTVKKKDGGLMEAIKRVDRQQSMKAKEGKVVRMTKRKSKNKNIARGCGAIMSARRKKTKYS